MRISLDNGEPRVSELRLQSSACTLPLWLTCPCGERLSHADVLSLSLPVLACRWSPRPFLTPSQLMWTVGWLRCMAKRTLGAFLIGRATK